MENGIYRLQMVRPHREWAVGVDLDNTTLTCDGRKYMALLSTGLRLTREEANSVPTEVLLERLDAQGKELYRHVFFSGVYMTEDEPIGSAPSILRGINEWADIFYLRFASLGASPIFI